MQGRSVAQKMLSQKEQTNFAPGERRELAPLFVGTKGAPRGRAWWLVPRAFDLNLPQGHTSGPLALPLANSAVHLAVLAGVSSLLAFMEVCIVSSATLWLAQRRGHSSVQVGARATLPGL